MKRFEQNDTIITIEKQLQAEMFQYHKALGEGFSSIEEMLGVGERLGEIAKAVQALRQARAHMSNVRE